MTDVVAHLETQLSCKICEERYDEDARKPMILHGGHTFCNDCLIAFKGTGKRDQVECPLCRAKALRSQASVNLIVLDIVRATQAARAASESGVQPSPFSQPQPIVSQPVVEPVASQSVNESVDQSKSSSQSSDQSNEQSESQSSSQSSEQKDLDDDDSEHRTCDLCAAESLSSEPSIHCFDCHDYLCSDHARMHSRKKDKANHETHTMVEIKASPKLSKRASVVVRFPVYPCPVHSSEANKLEFYCSTCDEFICVVCAREKHQQHDKQEIATKWAAQQIEAAKFLEASEELDKKHLSIIQLLETEISVIDAEEEKGMETINVTINRINEMIDRAKAIEPDLENQIRELCEKKRAKLRQQLETTTALKESIDNGIAMVEQCVEMRDFLSIASVKEALRSEIDRCVSLMQSLKPDAVEPICKADMKPVVDQLIDQLNHHIQHWFDSMTVYITQENENGEESKQPVPAVAAAPAAKPAAPVAAVKPAVVAAPAANGDDAALAVVPPSTLPPRSEMTGVTWKSILERLYQMQVANLGQSANPRDVSSLAEDIRMRASDRQSDLVYMTETQWDMVVSFIYMHLTAKPTGGQTINQSLFHVLSDALIMLLVHHRHEIDEESLGPLLDSCHLILRSHDTNSLAYSAAYRLSWALPGNLMPGSSLESNQSQPVTAVWGGINQPNTPSTPQATLKHVRDIISNLKSLSMLRSLHITDDLNEDLVDCLSANLHHVVLLRSLAVSFTKSAIKADVFNALVEKFTTLSFLTQLSLANLTDSVRCQAVADRLKDVPSLKLFSLKKATFTREQMTTFCDNLGQLTALRTLELIDCSIDSSNVDLLCKALSSLPELRRLVLDDNTLTPQVFDAIKSLPQLREISVKRCHFTGKEDWSVLKSFARIEKIDLSHNQLVDQGNNQSFSSFCSSLSSLRSFRALSLESVGLNEESCRTLGQSIAQWPRLSTLNLANNPSIKQSITFIANNFHSLSLLRYVNLSTCSVGDAGIESVMSQFEPSINPSIRLVTLDVSHNAITDTGAQVLADHLLHMSTLTSLKLAGNAIKETGSQAIADQLNELSQLVELDLSGNVIGNAGKAMMENLVNGKASLFNNLRSLNLAGTQLGDACQLLCDNLKKFRSLRVLDLSNVGTSEEIASKSLIEALKGASVPADVKVEGNNLSASTMQAIKELLKHSAPC